MRRSLFLDSPHPVASVACESSVGTGNAEAERVATWSWSQQHCITGVAVWPSSALGRGPARPGTKTGLQPTVSTLFSPPPARRCILGFPSTSPSTSSGQAQRRHWVRSLVEAALALRIERRGHSLDRCIARRANYECIQVPSERQHRYSRTARSPVSSW